MKKECIGDVTLYTGDVLSVLATMPDESVHCVVTSPPYWGLRRYGNYEMQTLFGSLSNFVIPRKHPERWLIRIRWRSDERGGVFSKNKASWIGAHGLEPTPELYVQHETEIFREVRRVLRKDGTAWVNLGSSYAGSGKGPSKSLQGEASTVEESSGVVPSGFKPKDMIPIPWMVAMALQADGWYLRSDIIWAKPNPMPESVTDRPTKAHEYLFLLSKSARYFYDADAVREEHKAESLARYEYGLNVRGTADGFVNANADNPRAIGHCQKMADNINPAGRNRRTVWTIATEPFPGAHFATFPRKLVQPCILAGCPEHACPKCGAPWVREYSRELVETRGKVGNHNGQGERVDKDDAGSMWNHSGGVYDRYATTPGSEHPTCACGLAPIGGTVMDPFGGSGTTAEVALEYGRRAILIELKPEYVELQKRRLAPVADKGSLLDFAGTGT